MSSEESQMPKGLSVGLIPALAPDGTLYPIEKLEAHKLAVPHLAISIFVFDGNRMLLQRRALTKYHCGGKWANTCCSHPHWGETLEASADRRLFEELGFNLPLMAGRKVEYKADVGQGLTEHEHVTFYFGHAKRDELAIAPNPAEVMDTRWATYSEVAAAIAENPENYAPWFRIYMERYPDFGM
ncbi:MAG: isopentenyl-diphosphate Delta-isomerase [Notoacmeibacter sp.]